jgi:hypothetical protein
MKTGATDQMKNQGRLAPVAPGHAVFENQSINAGRKSNGAAGVETHPVNAPAAPDQENPVSADLLVSGALSSDVESIVRDIRAAHRRRRYAMKLQQKIDRALESYVRSNYTDWNPDMDTADRERIKREVAVHMKSAASGEHSDDYLIELVSMTNSMREPMDNLRLRNDKIMIAQAKRLPVYQWVETVHGAGALGLATICAEAAALKPDGSYATLSDYPTIAKLWKRLGFAPFDGHAGSTWKRATWRPRALTAEEWTLNPFSGERYAFMNQIAKFLIMAQWKSAKKTGADEGSPTGPYGKVYADRRKATAIVHPEWTKGHSHSDAIRIAMKKFLADLWDEWNTVKTPESTAS